MSSAPGAIITDPVHASDEVGSDDAAFEMTTPDSLPDGWDLVRLRDVAASFSGGTPPKSEPSYWRGSVPWLSPKDMKSTHLEDATDHISPEAAAKFSRVMPAGSVFVVVRGMILAKDLPVALTSAPMAFNQDMKALLANERVVPEFLLYAIIGQKASMTKEIGTSAHGTRRIGSSSIDELQIPLPPLEEQRAIGSLLRSLEQAESLESRRLRLLRELKAATLEKVFTDGMGGSQKRPTMIGELPAHWDVTELSTVLREPLRNGHSAPAVSRGDGVRTLTLTAVTKGEFSRPNTKITSADPERVRDLWLQDGDVFVERANTHEMVGLAALYRGAPAFAIFPDLLVRVRVDETRLIPEVLAAWLSTPFVRAYFQKHCSGAATSMPKIDQGTIARTPIPLPPIEEQELLCELFSRLDSRISIASQRSKKLHELFSICLHQLMSGTLRVASLIEHLPHAHA